MITMIMIREVETAKEGRLGLARELRRQLVAGEQVVPFEHDADADGDADTDADGGHDGDDAVADGGHDGDDDDTEETGPG